MLSEESGRVVVQVLGTNLDVVCEVCNRSFPAQLFDGDFASGVEVACPDCNGDTALTTRRPRRSRTSRLRPGIFMIDEVPNLIDENAQAHPQADVLLLVGLSSKIGQVEALAKSLASSAGALGRRVVYVGQEKLFKSSWAQYVDVYLQLDPQEWARRQLEAFQSQGSAQQSGRDMLESFLVPPPKAFSLGEKVGEYLESGSPNSCSLCLKDDLDVVHPCRVCHTGYCMQGPTAQEITSCVQLGNLDVTLDLTDTDVDKLIKTFLCPGCYIPSPGKEYPHLIRNPPFHVPDPPRHPRMVLVVFYITEFRLVATNLARQIAYTWYERGWECRFIPVSLDDLAHGMAVDVSWGNR
ncbi:hypothetical protein FRC08_000538 [Ceratobasidium sp. 394]|nr:hypothetical protein FRC08_000538 [Ceratobasidium sp. 394]